MNVLALCCIGYGLSRSFASAVIWQVVGGSMNSNISMVRCVVAEMYPDKRYIPIRFPSRIYLTLLRYRVRALTLLPLCANVGLLLGPLLGGLLSSQADMKTLTSYPYLLPNLTIAVMYIVAAGGVIFGVEETLLTYNRNKSLAQMIQRLLQRAISRPGKSREYAYSILDPESSPNQASEPSPRPSAQEQRPVPPAERNANTTKRLLSRVCSSNVFFTMLTHFIISGHLGTFNTLWSVFLSAHPEQAYDDDKSPSMSLGGGLGLQPRSVGITMSILGAIIVFLQIVIYPRLSDRFGTLKVWRVALYAFPIAYFCAPFPAFYASRADSTTSIIMEWVAVAAVLLIFGIGRTGVTPATTMLINDCAPDSSVRATVHSMATVLGNLSRSIFPVIALVVFGFGLKIHLVGLAFWCLTGLALLSCVASRYVRGSSRDDETA